MKKSVLPAIFLALFLSLCQAEDTRHDGRYLSDLTMNFKTPHTAFFTRPAALPALFILNRGGARDAVELMQRMPLANFEAVLLYDRNTFTEAGYDPFMKGTSLAEKQRECLRKINNAEKLIVLGGMHWKAIPAAVRKRLVQKIRNGTSFLMVNLDENADAENDEALQGEEIPVEMDIWSEISVTARQVGKGRAVFLRWNTFTQDNEARSIVPDRQFGANWMSTYDNDLMQIAAAMRFAAGLPARPGQNAARRIRQGDGKIIPEALAGEVCFEDTMDESGAISIRKVETPSAVGATTLEMPETAQASQGLSGKLSWEKPLEQTAEVAITLLDSPCLRPWYQAETEVAAGAQSAAINIPPNCLPTLAGFVQVKLTAGGQQLAQAEKTVYFPGRRLGDYFQMCWCAPRDVMWAHQLRETLGYTLGLTAGDGTYVTRPALFNIQLVTYTSGNSYHLMAGEKGEVRSPHKKYPDGDYCFYQPQIQEFWKARAKENIRALKPAVYNLGDELLFSYNAGYGAADEPFFREFLKSRYASIAELNDDWNTNYSDFSEIPVTAGRDDKNFAAWGDHRAYMDKMFADGIRFLTDEIHRLDPGIPVGTEGSAHGDFEETLQSCEYFGPYTHPVYDELLRSFGFDKIRSVWWGGYPDETHGGRKTEPLLHWETLLKGTVNGNSYFLILPGYTFSSIAADGTIAEFEAKHLPALDYLKAGAGELLGANQIRQRGVLIYWSHASRSALLLDPRLGDPNAKAKISGISDQTLNSAINDWSYWFWNPDVMTPVMNWAYHRGEGFDFVSERTLDRLKTAKVLFLCSIPALSDAEIAAIQEFVQNGGTVIADFTPGILKGNLAPRKTNPWPELFGTATLETLPRPAPADIRLDGLTASGVMSSGKPFQSVQYGKGKAILLNFALAEAADKAADGTSLDKMLDRIVPLKSEYTIAPVMRDAMLRVRDCSGFQIFGMLSVNDWRWHPGMFQKEFALGSQQEYTVKLPQPGFVYEVDKGLCGKSESIKFNLAASPFQLYSVFETAQKAPEFQVSDASRGEKIPVKLPALTAGRFLRLELVNPAGKIVQRAIFDALDKVPVFAVALNEPAGEYRMRLADVATGLATVQKLTMK